MSDSPPQMSLPEQAAAEAASQRQIALSDAKLTTSYTNFCRVTGTAEELIIDFGLNVDGLQAAGRPIELTSRAVMNLYTAKRLFHALGAALERHESTFGVIETNVQRRVSPSANR